MKVKDLLKKIAQDVQALSYRQLQHETLLKERDAQFSLIQDEWKMVREMKIPNPKRVLMHLALGVMNLLRNKALELMNTINHSLGELEKKDKKTQRRLG